MILQKILEEKQKEIELLRKKIWILENQNLTNNKIKFYDSIKKNKPFSIIAECKKQSPSLGIIREDYNPVEIAKFYESMGASAISVLTDSNFFAGSIKDLYGVSREVHIPVLRKDFIISREQILEAKLNGASAILLIARILNKKQFKELFDYSTELNLDCLVEIHNEKELNFVLDFPVKIIGINHRDLDTLTMNLNLSFELAPKIREWNKEIFIIAESGIEKKEIIQKLINYVDGFLIGTYFMKSKDIEKSWKELFNFHKLNIQ